MAKTIVQSTKFRASPAALFELYMQSWRSRGWKKSDPDSILILTFGAAPGGGRVDLVHANVPDHDYAGIKSGWVTHYWKPWKAYLARRGRA